MIPPTEKSDLLNYGQTPYQPTSDATILLLPIWCDCLRTSNVLMRFWQLQIMGRYSSLIGTYTARPLHNAVGFGCLFQIW